MIIALLIKAAKASPIPSKPSSISGCNMESSALIFFSWVMFCPFFFWFLFTKKDNYDPHFFQVRRHTPPGGCHLIPRLRSPSGSAGTLGNDFLCRYFLNLQKTCYTIQERYLYLRIGNGCAFTLALRLIDKSERKATLWFLKNIEASSQNNPPAIIKFN